MHPSPGCPHFSEIFSSQLDYVWNSLRRLGIPARDLEDAAHDVFLRVYGKLQDYDVTQPLKPWLFGFAFRVASEYRRSSQQREQLDPGPEAPDPGPTALDRLASAEAQELVQRALLKVPIERRAVLILHEIDGYAVPEIADALALPLNTAYSRLRVARDELRSALSRERARRGDHE